KGHYQFNLRARPDDWSIPRTDNRLLAAVHPGCNYQLFCSFHHIDPPARDAPPEARRYAKRVIRANTSWLWAGIARRHFCRLHPDFYSNRDCLSANEHDPLIVLSRGSPLTHNFLRFTGDAQRPDGCQSPNSYYALGFEASYAVEHGFRSGALSGWLWKLWDY